MRVEGRAANGANSINNGNDSEDRNKVHNEYEKANTNYNKN